MGDLKSSGSHAFAMGKMAESNFETRLNTFAESWPSHKARSKLKVGDLGENI
jgi:hypothetical protein